jgi:hypothetical protein
VYLLVNLSIPELQKTIPIKLFDLIVRKVGFWLDTVDHFYNPSYLGGKEKRIAAQGQPGQKVSETLFQKTSQAWWHIPEILAKWEE